MTREHYVAGAAPDWRAARPVFDARAPKPRAWDHPLTWVVLIVLSGAAAFVLTLAVAGWLP